MPGSTFPAKIDKLEAMIDFIIDFAQDEGLAPDKLSQVRLAAEEVLVNVINYAYPDKPGDVEIFCAPLKDKGIVVDIKDSGFPFNPLEKAEPDTSLPMEKRKIGGLGIFLAKKVMDELTYERKENKNVLRLIKHA